MATQFAPLIAGPTPGTGSPTTRCNENNRPANEPSLAAMTQKSIELLRQDRDGFFLRVESASIDKCDQASDLCGQIGETKQLDEAVEVALDFQKRNPDTLVVVTADHSDTSQTVGESSDTPGFYATVQTADSEPVRVSYGTGRTPGGQGHTGARIPVAAVGPQASNVLGIRDQTDLFHTLIGRGDSGRGRDEDRLNRHGRPSRRRCDGLAACLRGRAWRDRFRHALISAPARM